MATAEQKNVPKFPDCMEPTGAFKAHDGLITKLATVYERPKIFVSASRDKTLIVWKMALDNKKKFVCASPYKSLVGHGHFVSDVVLSSDGMYVLSASWDKTLRLWDIESGKEIRLFLSHEKDVTCVAFSENNRMILSGSRDNTIKLWNTMGDCKLTLAAENGGHTKWITSVGFGRKRSSGDKTEKTKEEGGDENNENSESIVLISVGEDKLLKFWDPKNFSNPLITSIRHDELITASAVTPDSMCCATGGKDGKIMLWDIENIEKGEREFVLNHNKSVVAMSFSPVRRWLAVAHSDVVKMWDLNDNSVLTEFKITNTLDGKEDNACCPVTLQWDADGENLLIACDDNSIRVWTISKTYDDYEASEYKHQSA